MRVLWVATKAPWPAVDGGRLVQSLTLSALKERGVRVTLVAPVAAGEGARVAERLREVCEPCLVELPARDLGWPVRALRSPLSIARHAHPAVRRRVAELVAAGKLDVVHAEQLQAFRQASAAVGALALVLRAQNVESDLWTSAAARMRFAGGLARREARRLARHEAAAVRRASATVALTERDAATLAALAGEGPRIETVPAPFPDRLPAGGAELPGRPPIVLLGQRGWRPNRDAERWFLTEIWPAVRRRVPGAAAHSFGGGGGPAVAGVHFHPPPADASRAFAPGAVLAVPLRIASGVRMKILEAWARGVPVVATSAAAAGLDARAGRELLVADDPESFAESFARLAEEEGLAARLVTAGRELLRSRHAPDRVAEALAAVYEEVSGTPRRLPGTAAGSSDRSPGGSEAPPSGASAG